jgi:hypothetical protein
VRKPNRGTSSDASVLASRRQLVESEADKKEREKEHGHETKQETTKDDTKRKRGGNATLSSALSTTPTQTAIYIVLWSCFGNSYGMERDLGQLGVDGPAIILKNIQWLNPPLSRCVEAPTLKVFPSPWNPRSDRGYWAPTGLVSFFRYLVRIDGLLPRGSLVLAKRHAQSRTCGVRRVSRYPPWVVRCDGLREVDRDQITDFTPN